MDISEDFKDYFSSVSENYTIYRPEYPEDLFDFLATLVDRNATVWDAACGSGQATIQLAKRFKHIIASDASESQIKLSKKKRNVEYHVWKAEKTDIADSSIDLITVAQALHWFDHQSFYKEACRVLKKTGYIAVWLYKLCKVNDTIDRRILDLHNNLLGPYWPKERTSIDKEYSNLTFPFTKIDAPQFQMTARWTLEQMLGYLSSWSATGKYMKIHGKNPIKVFAPQLQKLWPQDEIKQVSWNIVMKVGKPTN